MMIRAKFPDLTEDQFSKYEYDVHDLDGEFQRVATFAKALGVRGVPFTVLLEDGEPTKATRGFDKRGIEKLVELSLATAEEE